MQRQAEVDRLADAARSREELMEQRQLNQVLHAELQTLRQTMEARERVVEQISSDAAHVDTSNIDLPELQRRHRMLGAAYRSDRRRMDQLGHQVAFAGGARHAGAAALAAYAQLKEAHRSQSLQMQRLQEEASKVGRYRHTAKQQELVIQKLETMMQSALRDAKKAKGFEPQLESLKGQLKVAESELQKQRDTVLPAVTEEQVKLLMRAERAERRASAIEEEMTEAARQNAREIANLKLKLAEKEAQLMGGFGSSANLVLGELPGLGNSDEPRRDRGGLPPRHPSAARAGSRPASTRSPPEGCDRAVLKIAGLESHRREGMRASARGVRPSMGSARRAQRRKRHGACERSMLRGRAVAAALCVLVPAARADLFGQDEDLCARVDADHSNMWEDQAPRAARARFDLRCSTRVGGRRLHRPEHNPAVGRRAHLRGRRPAGRRDRHRPRLRLHHRRDDARLRRPRVRLGPRLPLGRRAPRGDPGAAHHVRRRHRRAAAVAAARARVRPRPDVRIVPDRLDLRGGLRRDDQAHVVEAEPHLRSPSSGRTTS